jgi:hypothetical protein
MYNNPEIIYGVPLNLNKEKDIPTFEVQRYP